MQTLTQVVRTYVGTPFEHQGRVPGPRGGIDCVGLIVCGWRELGHYIRDFRAYGRDSDPTLLLMYVREFFDTVPLGAQQQDDAMLFWELDPARPQHAVVFTGKTLIHAFDRRATKGRVREERLMPTRMAKLHSVWRFRRVSWPH